MYMYLEYVWFLEPQLKYQKTSKVNKHFWVCSYFPSTVSEHWFQSAWVCQSLNHNNKQRLDEKFNDSVSNNINVSAAVAEASMQTNSIFCGSFLTCIDVASHFFPALLRGHPCKNQTKIKFLRQGSKLQIVSRRLKVAHGRHKITPYVDCVTKEWRSIPAFEITQNRTGERFQKQITNLYPVLLNYFVFYHLKFLQSYSAIVLSSTIMHQC